MAYFSDVERLERLRKEALNKSLAVGDLSKGDLRPSDSDILLKHKMHWGEEGLFSTLCSYLSDYPPQENRIDPDISEALIRRCECVIEGIKRATKESE